MKKLGLLIMPLMTLSLLASCNSTKAKEWYNDTKFIKSLTSKDIGLEKKVKVNDLDHKVRLIGVDHDDLANGKGKAHTTWEFVNTISSSDGYLRAVPWDNKDGRFSTNYSYSHSRLNEFLNGKDDGDISKSLLGMVPPDLANAIKLVNKKVGESTDSGETYVAISYQTKFFPLSKIEIGQGSGYTTHGEGEKYQYYEDHPGFDNLLKFEVNEERYNIYWLRSASTEKGHEEMAWTINYEGGPQEFDVYYCVYSENTGVAPAFCI